MDTNTLNESYETTLKMFNFKLLRHKQLFDLTKHSKKKAKHLANVKMIKNIIKAKEDEVIWMKYLGVLEK